MESSDWFTFSRRWTQSFDLEVSFARNAPSDSSSSQIVPFIVTWEATDAKMNVAVQPSEWGVVGNGTLSRPVTFSTSEASSAPVTLVTTNTIDKAVVFVQVV